MRIKAGRIWLTTWKTCSRTSEKNIKLFLVKYLQAAVKPRPISSHIQICNPTRHVARMVLIPLVDLMGQAVYRGLPGHRTAHVLPHRGKPYALSSAHRCGACFPCARGLDQPCSGAGPARDPGDCPGYPGSPNDGSDSGR